MTAPWCFERTVEKLPQAGFEFHVSFQLPAGEYEFLAGYGGGMNTSRTIASNEIAFDMKADGCASLVKKKGQ